MKALIIIAGIIAFFVILLSVKLSATVHYDESFSLDVNWLFIRFRILPAHEKKKKKAKKKKDKPQKITEEEPKQEEETKEETKTEPSTDTSSPGGIKQMFTDFYRNMSVDGVLELLRNLKEALGGMFHRILMAFIVDDLFISLIVGKGDANDTALKFGKTCEVLYPLLGFLCTKMRIRKPRCEVIPDFINGTSKARFHAKISVVPRRLLNAIIIVGVQIGKNVLLKFLYGAKSKRAAKKRMQIYQ